MKSTRDVSRRLPLCINLAFGVATALVLVNCGGGERPPPQNDFVDAGGNPFDNTGKVTLSGADEKTGILFGDNGFVNCGAQASNQTISMSNPNSKVVNFTATITSGGDKFKVQPEKGGIPAHGSFTVSVVPNPIPVKADVGADLFAGTLEVKLDNETAPRAFRLHQTARGAIIKTTVGTGGVAFGDVKVNTTAEQRVTLTNQGNMEVTANFSVDDPLFKVEGQPTASAKIGPGGSSSTLVTFTPKDIIESTSSIALSYSPGAAFCDAKLEKVDLKGKGTSSVTVSPGTLAFGDVDCGSTGTPRTLTVASTQKMTVIATLANGGNSYFKLANDATGASIGSGQAIEVEANVPFVYRVVPKTVQKPSPTTDNGLGDKLKVETDVPNDKPRDIDLSMTARGAVLKFGQAQIVHNGTINQTANNALTVVNSGNAAGNYSVAVAVRDGDTTTQLAEVQQAFQSTLTSGTAQVGTTAGSLISHTPSSFNTTILGALQMTSTSNLCEDLPPKLPLTAASGAGTTVTVDRGALNYGLVDCGATYVDAITAKGYQLLKVSSVGNTSFTPTFGKGVSTPFKLQNDTTSADITQGDPITITAGQTITLRVVPLPIPSRPATGVTANAFGDVLTITSPVDTTPINVNLSQTARGVIFAFNPTNITCGGTSVCANPTFNFTLVNTGNVTGAYTITTPPFITSNIPAPSPGSAPVGTTNGVLTRATGGTATGQGNMTMTSSSVLCADLPNMPIFIQ